MMPTDKLAAVLWEVDCHLNKALDDVSFSVEQGEVVGLIGTNGARKTGNWCLTPFDSGA